MAAVSPAVLTIDQYLSMSFERDVEFIDGELKEKPLPAFIHGRVQMLLGIWFRQFEKELGIISSSEPRTRVTDSRVRLPDFVLVRAAGAPKKLLRSAPLLAIEILSEDDKVKDLAGRARDLEAMGCSAIWLLDPEEKTLAAWSGVDWTRVTDPKPMTPARAPLDLLWLWEELAPFSENKDDE